MEGQFPWLIIRKDNDAVICNICIWVPKEFGNMQFITGSKPHKKETFQIHATSNGHPHAYTALLSQKKPVRETMLVQSLSKAKNDLAERDPKEVAVKMMTAYFVGKEELPFSFCICHRVRFWSVCRQGEPSSNEEDQDTQCLRK